MKIAVAQSRPIVGPIEGNLAGHQALINLATRNDASLVVFPELSLTGYEPSMAASLVRPPNDPCFASLQAIVDQSRVSIAVGVPTLGRRLPRISALLFRPNLERLVYSKQSLHKDEESYFEPGPSSGGLIHANPTVALAICYELSIPLHAQRAMEAGAVVYSASVAKTAQGVTEANLRLSEIARKHSAVTMMANCVGMLDGAECDGRSSVWGRNGKRLMQLESQNEGVIVLDSETENVVTEVLSGAGQ